MAGTGVGKFSSTAGNNTANMTVNFAENMAPSNVNNAARELMGHMRDMYEQLGDGYFEFGDGDGTYTVARSDADTITITSSSDISGVYFAGRKIRITDGGANVVEGTIASSSHSSTTQTVNLTGISLASGTPTKVELGIDTAAFGGRVILDDDGDTYIEAPTDDTIDIYVGGAKDFVITANTFTAESGSTIAAQALTATTITTTGAIAIANDGNIGSAGDADAIAISSSGVVTFSQAPVFPDGSISLADLDIDGATDIGAAIVDADLFIIDDGAGGTNRKVTASRLKTYAGATSSFTEAVTITTADNTDTLSLISTDTDSAIGPNLNLYRNAGNGADADNLATIAFAGNDDAGNATDFARITAQIDDASNGSEDVFVDFRTIVAGTEAKRMSLLAAETVFNEDSNDLDFRVESNSLANAFLVNGGTDQVVIGEGTLPGTVGGATPVFNVVGTAGATTTMNFHRGSGNAGAPVFYFSKSRSATLGSFTSVNNADQIGEIDFCADDGTDINSTCARIRVAIDGTPGSNDVPGRIVFFTTADGSASPTERFRIAANGDLTATDTSIGSNSDSRLKENVADYTYDISKFKQFQAKTFDWKNPAEHNGKTGNRGFIAQEVAAIDDYWTDEVSIESDTEDAKLITADSEGIHKAYTLKLGKKDAMYVSVIQQLIARIEALEA